MSWLVRKLMYAILIVLGVNLFTTVLFFQVNSPDDIARFQLGSKRVTPEAIERWKKDRGLDQPLLWNASLTGGAQLTQTIFMQRTLGIVRGHLGVSEDGRDILREIQQRALPSLAVALPSFVGGLVLAIVLGLVAVMFRAGRTDRWMMAVCVVLMSISSLFYIILGQYWFSKVLLWFPISGYDPASPWVFLVLPIIVSILAGLGGEVRWYRSLFVREVGQSYVQAARARGLSEWAVLWRHVLPNTMIPILTGVVVVIPRLFLGSLILESFFGIPGLGSLMIEAIQAQDFNVVQSMVLVGTVLYLIGLLLTDVMYAVVDPRVRVS